MDGENLFGLLFLNSGAVVEEQSQLERNSIPAVTWQKDCEHSSQFQANLCLFCRFGFVYACLDRGDDQKSNDHASPRRGFTQSPIDRVLPSISDQVALLSLNF
jgi:hypothetical protein